MVPSEEIPVKEEITEEIPIEVPARKYQLEIHHKNRLQQKKHL
jgi:hypothetical protein